MLSLGYGTISAMLTAVHAVMVKSATRTVGGSILKLSYWSNLMSATFLLPIILLNGEFSLFLEKMIPIAPAALTYTSTSSAERTTFFIGSAITGVFGFLLCLAGLLSIKVTSPVSHMVSSAARSVLQTVLGVLIFGEIVSERRAWSIAVITIGALYYTWIQSHARGAEVVKETRHGHTRSLATLLPLHVQGHHHRRRASGPSTAGGSSPASPLGSISEEEEDEKYFMNEEKTLMMLMPEDDRERSEREKRQFEAMAMAGYHDPEKYSDEKV